MRAVIRYPGAKWSIAQWIISHFPENYEKMVYLEPFAGSGAVFFNKRPGAVETINDLDSDIGSYAYRWGRSASRNETFLVFCCRWLSNGDWLLRKCVGERHVSKEFLREKAEAVLREMVIEYNAGDVDFDEDCLDDMMGFAAGYDSEPKAWALAIQTYADARGYDLPEEWYECIEEDYTPWQKRFAEICREVIVPELEKLKEDE